jgi:SAM-dependent methyltransferase
MKSATDGEALYWADDVEFCRILAAGAGSVFDLGCGTGVFLSAIAPGRRVVGVDPARAMLDIARSRPGGDLVEWVQADARTVRLDQTFDLIVMTGHAFQCLLTDQDALAVLTTMKAHLAPKGRFIFDMRNPAVEEWREWTPDESRRMLQHPLYGDVESWNDVSHEPDTGIVHYDTFYRIAGKAQPLHAQASIRFVDQARLSDLIARAGLAVAQWLGDWKGGACASLSKEIIPLGRLAQPSAHAAR